MKLNLAYPYIRMNSNNTGPTLDRSTNGRLIFVPISNGCMWEVAVTRPTCTLQLAQLGRESGTLHLQCES